MGKEIEHIKQSTNMSICIPEPRKNRILHERQFMVRLASNYKQIHGCTICFTMISALKFIAKKNAIHVIAYIKIGTTGVNEL